MGFKIGEMFWKVEADTKDFDKGVKSTETSAKGLGKSLTAVGKAVAIGFAGAIVAGTVSISKELITAASNAEETRNKFNVVFGDVQDGASEAAERIRDEFGTSTFETETFLSGIGDITSGLGATSQEALDAAEAITSLGLDINSFANLSGGAEQSVKALTSLFTGEREAAKALGIVINDTNLKQYAEDTGKVFSELTSLEKGFLSLELATSQSQNALGDAERSAGSYANQVKRTQSAVNDLSVALGNNLLPAATSVVTVFGKLTREFADAVTQANAVNNIIDDLGDGGIKAEYSMAELEATLATLNARKLAGSALSYDKTIDSEIASIEGAIAAYGDQDGWLTQSIDKKGVDARATEALTLADEERAKAIVESAQEAQIELDRIAIEAADAEEERRALREELDQTSSDVKYELLAEEERRLQEYNENAIQDYRDRNAAILADDLALAEAQELLNQQKLASATSLFGGLSALLGAAGKESRAALVAQKVFSAVQAGINSGVAFTKTLADGGPFPFNVINAAGVLASGIAQQVQILSTPIPSFATGGIVQGAPSAGDSVQANLTPGEEVISQNDPRHSFNGGSQMATFVLNVDGNMIAKTVINDYVNTGRYLVNLKRGAR